MEVEILGVLRGARGPGHDMILVQLHGAKPEYTGVVAGMSGSPVYIGNRLLGSLSYRIGQFSKDPIAGITPIEQMLEVLSIKDPATTASGPSSAPPPSPSSTGNLATGLSADGTGIAAGGMNFQAMETPLLMSGFRPKRFAFGSSEWRARAWKWLPPGALALRPNPIPSPPLPPWPPWFRARP